MVDRQWGATMVLTEPDAGSDVGACRTRAVRQADGSWHVEGVKRLITSGEHDLAENIVHFVLARPEGHKPGTKGLSLFLVPKFHVADVSTGRLGGRNGVFAAATLSTGYLNAVAYAEGLRALVLHTATVQDRIAEAEAAGGVDEEAKALNDLLLPIVKGYSSERACEQLNHALQTFGGAGYLKDFPLEQYIRDTKIDTLYEGTTAIQGLDFFFARSRRTRARRSVRS